METLLSSLMFLASYLNWSGVLGLALGRFVCLYLYQGWSLGFFLFFVLYLIRLLILNYNFYPGLYVSLEGQAWCSGESCLTEPPGHGFEAASPQILRGEGLPRFFTFPRPHSCGSLRHWACPFVCVSGFTIMTHNILYQWLYFRYDFLVY